MTSRIVLASAFVLAAAAAPALAETQADRDLTGATRQLEKGEHILSLAAAYERPAAKLYAYEQAAETFVQSRRTAAHWSGPAFESVWNDASAGLVRAYDGQAEVYYDRGSLTLARRQNAAALEIDATDDRARNLKVMIEAAEQKDILDKANGQTALTRITERRAAAGMPLRERGVPVRQ